jgi:hypothetical protein
MLKNFKHPVESSKALLSLLPTSGTLAGISIGLVGLIHSVPGAGVKTVVDDLDAFAALGFLVVCYLVFFALRHQESRVGYTLLVIIDTVFLISLTLLVFSGFLTVYEVI